MIAVVIPFFQRQEGVLARALRSIAAQRGCPLPVRVIVVDDASPVRARDELARQAGGLGLDIQVIEQANAGPGGARNAALDALGPDTDYVAFLDSDDEWTAAHLLDACRALALGYDVFFSNHLQLDAEVGAFERAGRLDMARHRRLQVSGAPDAQLYGFEGDMNEQIMSGNVIGTSAVVYRRVGRERVRFRTEYRRAGEDYLMWLELAAVGSRFAFSTDVGVRCGRGVNIFAGVAWGSLEFLERTTDELRYRKAMLAEFARSPTQKTLVEASIGRTRTAFALGLLHALRRWPGKALKALGRYLAIDPAWLWKAPGLVMRSRSGRTG